MILYFCSILYPSGHLCTHYLLCALFWMELCPSPHKRYVQILLPVPVDLTLFGNKTLADVIKLKSRLYWTMTGPDPMTGVLIRRWALGHRFTHREQPVKLEAEVAVMHLQAKECQLSPATASGCERALKQIFPQTPEETIPAASRFQTLGLQNCD